MAKRFHLALPTLFVLVASLLPSPAQEPSQLASEAPSVTRLPIGPAISERVCALPTPGLLQCMALRLKQRPAEMALASGVSDPNSAPSGFGPADLESAYNLVSASASNGSGVTIAIVDAMDDPHAEADLGFYRLTFGLPPCTTANGCFKKVNQNGNASPLPTADTGWAGEIALDIEMVSAICPNCNILLVEATSANNSDLDKAEDTAFNLGAKAISNSYGGSESSSDTGECVHHFNHPGVAITVSSGDEGYEVEFPAACGLVTAVGGTSLKTTTSNARGWTESVWSTSSTEGTGSGCSHYEVKPAWQADTGCTKRTVADVSAVADPATGVAVYDTYGGSGWNVYGGTSVSSPLIAGVYGLAQAALSSDVPAMYAYANAIDFNDVTTGQTSSCGTYFCKAETGYDGPTGLGTPNGVGGFEPATPDDFSISGNPSSLTLVQGTYGTIQISTTITSGSAETVTLSARGLPTGVTASFSPASISSGQNATVTLYSGTVNPNIYSFTVVGSASSGAASTGLGLTVTAASPATITSPAPSSTLTGSSATFAWTTGSGVNQYLMHVGTTGAGSSNIANTGSLHTTSTTIGGIPTTGATLNVRLYSYIAGAWQYNDYTFLEASPAPAVMSAPASGSTVSGSSVTFTWTAGNDVSQYLLHVGTTGAGSSNIVNTGSLHTTSTTVSGIPTTGAMLYVRLYSYIAGAWQFNDYTYTQASPAPAVMITPTADSTLSGPSVTFTWTAGIDVNQYLMHVGTTGAGSSNVVNTGSLHTTSTTITGIPTTGGTLNVRLYSYIAGAWQYNDYTYREQ